VSEKERILNQDAWPLWPRLPMKRRKKTGLPDLGFILADDLYGPIKLYKGPVFAAPQSLRTQEFSSLDALLAAGWVGD